MNTWFPDGTLLFSLAQVVSGFLGLGPILFPEVPLNSLCFSLFPDVGFRSFLVLGFLGLVWVFGLVCPGVPFFFFFLVPSVKLSPSGVSASRASAW